MPPASWQWFGPIFHCRWLVTGRIVRRPRRTTRYEHSNPTDAQPMSGRSHQHHIARILSRNAPFSLYEALIRTWERLRGVTKVTRPSHIKLI